MVVIRRFIVSSCAFTLANCALIGSAVESKEPMPDVPSEVPAAVTEVPAVAIEVTEVSVDASQRPFIWVDDSDRASVLEKIDQQPWAAQLYQRMKAGVDSYVERHEEDPEWILGRVQLTWGGPNYTDFRMDKRVKPAALVASGNAEHPTVRFITGKMPVTAEGNRVNMPKLADVPPFNTHPTGGMLLVDRITGEPVMVPYIDRYLRDINRRILEMAVDASVLYWLTEDERYAAFSADILSLYCEALAPMNTNRADTFNWGLISNNHLLEARWFSNTLPIVYDFISPYIEGHSIYDAVAKVRRPFDRGCAQEVFRKYIHLAIEKGILNCNWVVFESSSLVNNALALDDVAERERYMQFFLNTDTKHQQSMQTFMGFFTEDDYWFESLSYGNETINFLTYLFSIVDRHYPGLELLDTYPVLYDAIHVMPRYQFPNGDYARFGDSHRQMEVDPYAYEMMTRLAVQHGEVEQQQRAEGVLQRLIEEGEYHRSDYEKQSYVYTRPLKLLWFQPELTHEATSIERPRSDTLAHAGLILQRNAEDAANGMMVWQGGAHHVHAHASGMHMELYGLGEVVGAEAGKSIYRTEIHQQYYRLYAAHNTVIVNNASRGHEDWVDLGQETVQVVTAEPASRARAVSPECSFATTSFTNHYGADALPAEQQRTMALIRTTPTTGYYVDVYRSRTDEAEQFHDYIYHNLGSQMKLSGDFELGPAADWFGSDIGDAYRQPGTRWFQELSNTGLTSETVKATFRTNLSTGPVRTGVWFPAGIERAYASVMAPPTLKSLSPYDSMDTPTVVVRREGEAWEHPFEAVYEMYRPEVGRAVQDVRRLDAPAGLTVLQVSSQTIDGDEVQTVLTADRSDGVYTGKSIQFKGRFAVCSAVNGEPEYIYLGDAVGVSFMGWRIVFADGRSGAADIRFENGVPVVSSESEVIITKEN